MGFQRLHHLLLWLVVAAVVWLTVTEADMSDKLRARGYLASPEHLTSKMVVLPAEEEEATTVERRRLIEHEAMFNVHQLWQQGKKGHHGRSLAVTPTVSPGSSACDQRAAVACLSLSLGFYQDAAGGCLTFFACFSGVSQCYSCPPGFKFDQNGYCSPGSVTCTGAGVQPKTAGSPPPASTVTALSVSSSDPPAAVSSPGPKASRHAKPPSMPESKATVSVSSETMASTAAFTTEGTGSASCAAPNQALCIGKKYGFYQDASLGCSAYFQCYDGGVQCYPCPAGLKFDLKGYCTYSATVTCTPATAATPAALLPASAQQVTAAAQPPSAPAEASSRRLKEKLAALHAKRLAPSAYLPSAGVQAPTSYPTASYTRSVEEPSNHADTVHHDAHDEGSLSAGTQLDQLSFIPGLSWLQHVLFPGHLPHRQGESLRMGPVVRTRHAS